MATDRNAPNPALGSFERPVVLPAESDDPKVLYAKSYLAIRTAVGLLAIALPIVLILGEAIFLEGSVQVRGSISSYYHTPMRDVFVGTLSVCGFLLAMYMFGQRRLEYWYSLAAGLAALGVAFVPTGRPGIPESAPLCGADAVPSGCGPVQQLLGETTAAGVHFAFAVVFVLCLARIALIFAYREDEYTKRHGLANALRICAWAIVAAILWIGVGGWLRLTIWRLTPLYVGEVVAVWAFGISWLLKGGFAQRFLPAPRPDRDAATT